MVAEATGRAVLGSAAVVRAEEALMALEVVMAAEGSGAAVRDEVARAAASWAVVAKMEEARAVAATVGTVVGTAVEARAVAATVA